MRIAVLDNRASLVVAGGFIDIAEASSGQFGPSINNVLASGEVFAAWVRTLDAPVPTDQEREVLQSDERLSCVSPTPRQVFAIGLNYREHAHEMGLANPTQPMVFTKFHSSLAGQHAQIPMVSDHTDWEAEMVVVIGQGGRSISVDDALGRVAGFAVGQDISDRHLQLLGSPAQFSLGKSWQNFGPVGPWVTTLDELTNPNDLAITCDISGERMQDSRTSDMVFTVAEVVSYLSNVVELFPGDLIFTGSPHGVGQGLTPPRFLKPGHTIATTIEGLGTLFNEVVAP